MAHVTDDFGQQEWADALAQLAQGFSKTLELTDLQSGRAEADVFMAAQQDRLIDSGLQAIIATDYCLRPSDFPEIA